LWPAPKELFSLRWENVDFDHGIIRGLEKRKTKRPENRLLKPLFFLVELRGVEPLTS
jgi:hypothetical protein